MKILDFFAVQASGFLHGGGAKGSQHLFSQLKLSGNESILEVGVGTGASLVALKSIWPDLNLVGVEVNEQMLETAKKRLQFCGLKDVTINKIDPNVSYPFQDASFDLVIVESVLAIQSIEGLEKLLVEIHRILKPRGVLAINETIWLFPKKMVPSRAIPPSLVATTSTALSISVFPKYVLHCSLPVGSVFIIN